jgi:membrane dipeptidase
MPKNGGVVMVNFYSGFIVPEAARLRKRMFETARELKAKYPDEKEFETAMAQYRKDNPIPRGDIHMVVDHIEHIIKVAGIDHVGLGSDFDGIDSTPEGLDDVSRYPYITQELLNRGYKPDQIRKVLGENFMRTFRAIEQAAGKK